MSKKWKIVTAVSAALVVVVIAGAGWFINQGWTPGTLAQSQGQTRSLEVHLIDDYGDKAAGRGVIDHAPKGTFNSDFGSGHGRDFGPTRGRPFGFLLAPLCFIGGLIGLGLLTSLAIFFYRRRQPAPPAAPISASPGPDEVQSAPDETRLDLPVTGESIGDESNEGAMDNTP